MPNLYATLAEYKYFATPRGQDVNTYLDDDAVLSAMLEQVSRYVDLVTNRRFYPSYETHLYDIPRSPSPLREIPLDDDLLAVDVFTNGNGSVIASTDYVLQSANITPYWQIALRDSSTVSWEYNSAGSYEQVLSLAAWWGYRTKYAARAWTLAGTLGAAITDTTAKAFTMTAGHSLAVGNIVKIGSEIYNIATVSVNNVTPNQRGDNGSTAATHAVDTAVYVWNVQEEIKLAVLETMLGVSSLRSGQSSNGQFTITAAGVVIRPQDVPPMAQKVFEGYRSLL